jgi:hypothetical protein
LQFVCKFRDKKVLKRNNLPAVANAYNGLGYRDNNYDEKLEAAYEKYKGE